MSGTPAQRAAEAVAQLQAAYNTARAVIADAGDLHAQYDMSMTLWETCRSMTDDASKHKATIATRIYDAEALSLAGLANKIGVSKSRAEQLVRGGREAQKETTP